MYSARDVAQIIGVQESRVRYWAQTGFVGPSGTRGGRPAYTFQDLIGVKAAKELLDRGLTMQRVRKNLEALKAQLPGVERPLAELRIVSDGERLVVLGEGARFEALSGQLVMDFGLQALEADVRELHAGPQLDGDATAWAWFLEGTRLDAEPGREEDALVAYQRALEHDPQLAAAHTNLGNLFYRRGAGDYARRHYQAALTLDPAQPEARFNLGNLLEADGDRERAIAEWTRVCAECPEFADASFNLGALFAQEGSVERARVHLGRYLELDGEGEWAERARALLDGLSAPR